MPTSSHSACLPVGGLFRMGPRLVPLLVKPATTLSPPRLNSRISRCMSAKAPVELAWVNALEASSSACARAGFWLLAARLDEAGLVGDDDRLGAVVAVELREDARGARFDGGVADDERAGDVGVLGDLGV